MKRILLTACALLLMTPAIRGQILERDARNVPAAPSTWRTYTVKGEEFSVDLPTMPLMKSSVILHPRNLTKRHLKTFLDGVIYSIDVFENPEPRQSLEEFIAQQNANSDFELTPERDLVVNGFRGKEYLSRDKTHPETVQFFTTDQRLYRFAATGADAANDAVSQFFSSIRLVKPKDATNILEGPGSPLVLDTDERIYTGKEVTTKARLISKPEPMYTDEAHRKHTGGTVVLRVVFSKTGEVNRINVISGLPDGLTERAIDAARRIKFVPATKDGNPVSMWMQLVYNFNP
jgi:TonB family protein